MKKATLLHLRIPFSFFLLPVFCFAWSISEVSSWFDFVLVFLILHLFLYPASNGYNSYFDKDEGSIGGLERPPAVSRELYFTALAFDGFALLLGTFIDWPFVVMLLIYGLVSKAYSHPAVRLKKFPFLSWLVAGFFQGCFTFLMVWWALNRPLDLNMLWQAEVIYPALLTSVLLWGSYPMTQVYQHEEDARRGDITLSLKLGIKGTFYFTALVFLFAALGYSLYFHYYFHWYYSAGFLIFLTPVVMYFMLWMWRVHQDKEAADFRHTMRLNQLSAVCMNTFFILLYFFR